MYDSHASQFHQIYCRGLNLQMGQRGMFRVCVNSPIRLRTTLQEGRETLNPTQEDAYDS